MEAARRLKTQLRKGIIVNIVLLVDSLHSIAAGSERQIYKLAEGLSSAGHQLRLILLRHTNFTHGEFSFPCEVSSLNITSIRNFRAIKKMRALSRQLREENVDVVHAYFPDACLLAPLFLKSSNLRIVTSRRDMGLIYRGKPALLYRMLRHRTDLVISNSVAVAKHVAKKEGITPLKTRVIYNGIEYFSASQSASTEVIFKHPDSIKLILVANIKPVKRTLDAVMAVQQLIAKGNNVELALAGEEQDREYIQKIDAFIQAHDSLAQHIHRLGQVKEPRRLLQQAHIGLLVSESEGLSNTIMEYMQAGLPVIATEVGGNPELVFHKHTGLLIERGSVEQLTSAILELSSNPTIMKSYGENGKTRIANEFSIDSMVKQHVQAYSEHSSI